MSLDFLPEETLDLQWYEKDRERFVKEVKLIKKKHPRFEVIKLPDARISVLGDIFENCQICLIFPYLYPLQPPEVRIVSKLDRTYLPHLSVNYETKAVEYLNKESSWKPSINAVTVIGWVEEVLNQQVAQRQRERTFQREHVI